MAYIFTMVYHHQQFWTAFFCNRRGHFKSVLMFTIYLAILYKQGVIDYSLLVRTHDLGAQPFCNNELVCLDGCLMSHIIAFEWKCILPESILISRFGFESENSKLWITVRRLGSWAPFYVPVWIQYTSHCSATNESRFPERDQKLIVIPPDSLNHLV